MAEYVESLKYTADVDDIKAKLDQIARKVGVVDDANERAVRSIGQKWEDAGKKLTDFGARATRVATLPIAAGFALATKAASDLTEQMSKTDNVFGQAAAEVHRFATGAAKDIGQSRRQAEEAVGTFGNLFNQLGIGTNQSAKLSIELTKLASDFASFHNADPTEVLVAMTAAFRGEYDAVQRFVPTINAAAVEHKGLALGLAATKDELDAQDKALATNALLLEGAGKATGDFQRTSGSLANQMRSTKAELEDTAAHLGEKLIPFALKAATAAQGMLSWFSQLDPALQNMALGGAAVVAAIGPITSVAGHAAKAVGNLTDLARKAADSLGGGLQGALAGLAGAGAAVGLVAIGQGLYRATRQADELVEALTRGVEQNNLRSVRDALDAVGTELEGVNEEWRRYDGAKGIIRGTIELLTPLENKVLDNAKAADRLDQAQARLNADLVHAEENLNAVAQATGLNAEEVRRLADKTGVDLAGGFTKTTTALVTAHREMTTGTAASKDLASAQGQLADKVASAEDKLKALKTALDAALGVQISAEQAAISYADKVQGLRDAVAEHGRTTDWNTEAGRRNRQAILDMVEAGGAQIQAMAAQGATSEQLRTTWATQRSELENVMRQLGFNTADTRHYLGLLDAVPPSVLTTVTADTGPATAAIAELRRQFDALRRDMNAQGPSLFGAVGAGTAIPRRHSGGPVQAGHPYIVGRAGAEELFVPRLSGTIYPLPPTAASSVVINQEVTISGVADPAGIKAAMAEANRDLMVALRARGGR